MRTTPWGSTSLIVLGALGACHGDDKPAVDTDTALVDTDTPDTDVVDHETGDTASLDTDDTDAPDTDGEHVVLHGQLFCELPSPTSPAGVPATPGFAKITLVQPWYCPPLSSCSENTSIEVIAETTLDANGLFDLDFQTGPYAVEELYLYTNNKDGVCGNGYQFTQAPLTDYADFADIVIDVDSIFF